MRGKAFSSCLSRNGLQSNVPLRLGALQRCSVACVRVLICTTGDRNVNIA